MREFEFHFRMQLLKPLFSTCITMICFYRTLGSAPVTARSRAFSQAVKNVKAGVNAASKQVDAKPITQPSAVSKVISFPKDHPFAFQLIIATVKTSAADLVVQTVAEGKQLSEVDWRRNGIFVVFGFAYLGGFQYWLMVNKYRQWFPTMDKFAKMSFADKLKYPAGMLDAGKMVLFDVIVHLPMMYFPTYYTVKEFVGGSSWNPIDWARDGMTKYSKNMKVRREHKKELYFFVEHIVLATHNSLNLAYTGGLNSDDTIVGTKRLCPVCSSCSYSYAFSPHCVVLLDSLCQFYSWFHQAGSRNNSRIVVDIHYCQSSIRRFELASFKID